MASEPKRMKAIIKDPQHFKRVVESVQVLNMRQDLMDLCFICARGHRIFAHKLLLCSVSTQMKKMFLELPDNIDVITIHLPDIEARILRLLLSFLYEGSLKVVQTDYNEFKNLMSLLGIVLHRSTPSQKAIQLQPEALQSQQPVQSQAVFYVQAPGTNSQGQMQYVLATPATQVMQVGQAAAPGQVMQVTTPATSLPQGQVMQMAQSTAPGQMMQVAQSTAPGQMMQVSQSTAPGQMMQVSQSTAPGQMMQVAAPATSISQGQIMQMTPTIMSQANCQMVQGNPQVVTTPIQQNNMMQVVPQTNTQVVPMVTGNQMVQCSSQMVVQGSQPTIINNNQMQGNQIVQPTQRPQYAMVSTANHMTTSRARGQYTQPQTTPQQQRIVRSRPTSQAAQPMRSNAVNNVAESSALKEAILNILQENYKKEEAVTAPLLREKLELKLQIDLSNQEEILDQVLKNWAEECLSGESVPTTSVREKPAPAPAPTPARTTVMRRRKKRFRLLSDDDNDYVSDDDDDEDFDPKGRRSSRRK